jgi:hypothetical protein
LQARIAAATLTSTIPQLCGLGMSLWSTALRPILDDILERVFTAFA